MKIQKIHYRLFLIAIFALLIAAPLFGQPKDLVPFEQGDSIEVIRAKIKHNGYHFTVSNNWVYDMRAEEKQRFFSRYQPLRIKEFGLSDTIGPLTSKLGKQALPAKFDWRNVNGYSYIGPIQDQGTCGSCYAFAAAAAAEGTYNAAMGHFENNWADYSEAFIAFCLSDYYSGFSGCDGANYDYDELQALVDRGICDESIFPYSGVSQVCYAPAWSSHLTKFNSWHRIPCGDINAIKTAIMTYGVIDVAVWAGSAFQAYKLGVYEDTNTSCSSSPCYYTPTNHAVALVGWDDNPPEGGGGCWILRNSWGTSWGESGYMRIRYNSAFVACEGTYFVPGDWLTVTTTAAGSIMTDSAVLNGTINPFGSGTTYYFEYGKGIPYSNSSPIGDAGSGTANVAVNFPINGLEHLTTYHYRLVGTNIEGTAYGIDQSFTTIASPTVQTNDAGPITECEFRLNGTVNPNNAPTTYYFEYGGTTSYGVNTTSTSAGSGNSGVSVYATITSGISGTTTYHYRVVATNNAGTSRGDDKSFVFIQGSCVTINGGGGGGGGGCYIATAAHGSLFEKLVYMFPLFLLFFGVVGWKWRKKLLIFSRKIE